MAKKEISTPLRSYMRMRGVPTGLQDLVIDLSMLHKLSSGEVVRGLIPAYRNEPITPAITDTCYQCGVPVPGDSLCEDCSHG